MEAYIHEIITTIYAINIAIVTKFPSMFFIISIIIIINYYYVIRTLNKWSTSFNKVEWVQEWIEKQVEITNTDNYSELERRTDGEGGS